jgi:hypothetical protein
MARPPPRGVGIECELLSLGMSIIFFLSEKYLTTIVIKKEPAKMANRNNGISDFRFSPE